ncbi:MAG: (d)CMP kinase [Defluviitaleaceae bacterium]|nr:(d)CMP kinase [Defluviitaleaceae bacterium]
MPFAIAIDGPAGVGKSTTARKVAETLGMKYIDTGSMYRTIALYCTRNGISPQDEATVTAALPHINIELTPGHIFLNGEDVTGAIRTQAISDITSTISPYSAVREKMATKQKIIAASGEIVMDGRDIGSHVLPWAQVKIYLDADVDIRAERRAIELKRTGKSVDMEQLRKEIIERDHRDKTRKHSPLTQAEDAIYLDTGNMTKEEVVARIIAHINEARR